jgi:hypothetical protein
MWVPSAELAAFIAAALVGAGFAIAGGAVGVAVILLVVVAGLVLAAYVTVRAALVAAVLTDREVRTPRALRGWRVLPLAEVTGVGLRFRANGRASGWQLLVWVGPARAVGVRAAPPRLARSDGPPRTARGLNRFVPELDWDALADSGAGRSATAIAQRVVRIQGEHGLLGTEARQVSATNSGGFDTAYWSPDGRIGPLI